MVWDFVSSFGRLLHLFSFSLQDFENAICHKDSNLIIIVETYSAFLRLLIKDDGQYFAVIEEKKRKPKVRHSSGIQNFFVPHNKTSTCFSCNLLKLFLL